MKILYVEDNIANLSLMRRVAKIGGHEMVEMDNGDRVLNEFETVAPDLVLLDLQLTGRLDGLEVVRELRKRGVTVPVIAVTAYAMSGDCDRCLAAGCTDYMSKPLSVPDVVSLLREYTARIKAAKAVTTEVPPVPGTGDAAARMDDDGGETTTTT